MNTYAHILLIDENIPDGLIKGWCYDELFGHYNRLNIDIYHPKLLEEIKHSIVSHMKTFYNMKDVTIKNFIKQTWTFTEKVYQSRCTIILCNSEYYAEKGAQIIKEAAFKNDPGSEGIMMVVTKNSIYNVKTYKKDKSNFYYYDVSPNGYP